MAGHEGPKEAYPWQVTDRNKNLPDGRQEGTEVVDGLPGARATARALGPNHDTFGSVGPRPWPAQRCDVTVPVELDLELEC